MHSNSREAIDTLAKANSWQPIAIQKVYQKLVYAPKSAWELCIKWTLLILGLSFLVSGVLFFFAFNWDVLHKFVKLGMVLSLTVLFAALSVTLKTTLWIKNTLLFAASLMVGAVFAVFGQIYQTGADAYDFFLAWTIFIALWSILSKFEPLLLFFLLLIQTTISLYFQQVGPDWNFIQVINLMFAVQMIFYGIFTYVNATPRFSFQPWFLNVLLFFGLSYSTIGVAYGIFDSYPDGFALLLFLSLSICAVGYYLGWKKLDWAWVCFVPLSILIIIISFLLKITLGLFTYFLSTLLIFGGIALIIKSYALVNQKKHERIAN